MALELSDFWTWRGRVGRAKYAILGIVLFAVKHNIDRVIATLFGYGWTVFNYWIYIGSEGIEKIDERVAALYAVLLAVALPFIYVGVVLTIRRLRDAGLPLWFVLFFFLPFLNLFFFLILTIIPSTPEISQWSFKDRYYSPIRRYIPESEFGSAALGVIATTLLAVLIVVLGTIGLGNYGWGLFVGIPFFLGLNSVLIYGVHRPRSFGRCVLVASLSVVIVGSLIFGLAIEGTICLAMAAPLAFPIAIFGGIIGYILQQRTAPPSHTLRVVSLVFLVMPGFVLLENAMIGPPPQYEVSTSVIVKASPQQVWQHVIAFAELPPPTDLLFQTGIAYPTRARLDGQGVGAVRHCVFSTGEFIEPITTWDEPRLLQFDVRNQPPVMNEWSPYKDLRPPHLEHYLVSKRGQFLLTALPDGTTKLEGTTWYENRFWPATYWHWWSDYIIHRIHARVLTQIKNLAENQ